MKRLLLSICLMLALTGIAKSQIIQLQYDFGKSLYNELSDRPVLTSTIEHFMPDKLGSTFFFVDMSYASTGVTNAYMEIFREFKFAKNCPVSFHMEYNGGIAKTMVENKFLLNNAYLVGASYNLTSKDFSKGLSFSALYKYLQKHDSPQSFQFTLTWFVNFYNSMFTFNGFADYWREETPFGKMILVSEPQFWFNLKALKGVNDKFNLSVGTEVKLSNNFEGRDGFYCIPTIAVKWTL